MWQFRNYQSNSKDRKQDYFTFIIVFSVHDQIDISKCAYQLRGSEFPILVPDAVWIAASDAPPSLPVVVVVMAAHLGLQFILILGRGNLFPGVANWYYGATGDIRG